MREFVAILLYPSENILPVGIKLWVSGILAIIGGFLMVASGYVSRGFLFIALGYAAPEVSQYLAGMAADAILLAIAILEFIIALGGLTVLLGGASILWHHVRTGRILIFLGGGAGLLGLLISFGYTVFRLGIAPAISYAPYWVGILMAVAARRLAKGA